jgi:regulator of cell morphogenesis and NO signaling
MSDATLESPVGQVAARQPEAIRILEQHGIDYCCGGDKSLDAACHDAGIDAQEVLAQIERAEPAESEAHSDWLDASLTKLCDHIEQTHHAFLREQLPFLTQLIDKVVDAHGQHHPELRDVRLVFAALRAELEPHMMKEEQILFPAVRTLEKASHQVAFPFGSVQNPIRMMEHEHDNAGAGLRRLRELTDGFTAPDDACNAYRGLYEVLAKLEADLHEHIHKENNILFPRAAELEARQPAGKGDNRLPIYGN